MAWVRIDDQLTLHPKILAAGNAAVGAWVRLLAWTAAQGTDGALPDSIVRLVATQEEIDELVVAGLLDLAGDDSLSIHDYLDHNPPAAEVAERRRKRKEAGSKGGRRSASKRQAPAQASAQANAQASAQANTEAVLEAKRNPVPSRPVPSSERDGGDIDDDIPDDFEEPDVEQWAAESSLYETVDQLTKAGYADKGGRPGLRDIIGSNVARARRLLPVYPWELDAARKTKGRSWSYVLSVIESSREEEARGKAKPGQPQAPRSGFVQALADELGEPDVEGLLHD